MANTPSWVYVAPFGSTAIGSYYQQQLSTPPGGGSPAATTVFVQQFAIVNPADPAGGSPIGATVDGNGLHVVLQQGTPATSGRISAAALGVGSAELLTSPTLVTTGKVGTLQQAIFSATFYAQWDVEVINTDSSTHTFFTVTTAPNAPFVFDAAMNAQIASETGDGVHVAFQVNVTNLDTQVGANAYATFYWAEN